MMNKVSHLLGWTPCQPKCGVSPDGNLIVTLLRNIGRLWVELHFCSWQDGPVQFEYSPNTTSHCNKVTMVTVMSYFLDEILKLINLVSYYSTLWKPWWDAARNTKNLRISRSLAMAKVSVKRFTMVMQWQVYKACSQTCAWTRYSRCAKLSSLSI